jgi:hypothetical protein
MCSNVYTFKMLQKRKGKPVERQGRKAVGLRPSSGYDCLVAEIFSNNCSSKAENKTASMPIY